MNNYAQNIGPTTKRVLLKSVRNGKFVTSISGRQNVYLVADEIEENLSYPQVFLFCFHLKNSYINLLNRCSTSFPTVPTNIPSLLCYFIVIFYYLFSRFLLYFVLLFFDGV